MRPFPWRSGNAFELLVDGGAFFPAMLEAISQAKHEIWLELYLVQSGHVASQFVAAMIAAAERGVRVCAMLDAYGANGLSRNDRRDMERAGVRLEFYNPLQLRHLWRFLRRDHRKLLIIDSEIAFVGGAGLTDDFDPMWSGVAAWRDSMVAARGPVVSDWQTAFIVAWHEVTREWLEPLKEGQSAPCGTQRGRVCLSASGTHREVRRALIAQLRAAQQRVWLSTAYFVPSWKIRRLLRRAARRGVDVRLLLPGPHVDHPAVRHAGRRFYDQLLPHGVRIYEYQPRFLHAKTMLCDGWVSIGSSNVDRWNLRWNREGNQEIDHPEFAEIVTAMFHDDFNHSAEISGAQWPTRGLQARLLEWFWGRIDRFLDRSLPRAGE